MSKILTTAAILIALVCPAMAAPDDNTIFGAAITIVFNRNCRPVNKTLQSLGNALMTGLPEQMSAAIVKAEKLRAETGNEVFCAWFEPNVKHVEGD